MQEKVEPLVSVIIPNFNYASYVGEAIQSVLAQTYKNLEVIVVDDGSTDRSLEILAGFGDRINVMQQVNAGVSAARNNGVAHSKGDLIAFLDADDVWLPKKVERQVELFGAKPEVGITHVGVEEIDEAGNEIDTQLNGRSGSVARDLLLFDKPVILGGGSGLMIRRELFEAIGGFDASLSTSADWDFCYQASIRAETGFVPEVLLKYRMHSNNMHRNIAAMERDTTMAWAKAFRTDDTELLALRRHAYAGLHKVLAGSYLHNRQISGFIRNLLKSVWYRPSLFGYYLTLPIRRKKN